MTCPRPGCGGVLYPDVQSFRDAAQYGLAQARCHCRNCGHDVWVKVEAPVVAGRFASLNPHNKETRELYCSHAPCGRLFVAAITRGTKRRYCSGECQARALRKR